MRSLSGIKEKFVVWSVKANNFLSTPLRVVLATVSVLLLALLVMVVFFVIRGAEAQRRAEPVLEQIHQTSIDAKIASENTEVIIEGQEKTITALSRKIDILAEQNRCLIVAHGLSGVVAEEAQERCIAIANEDLSESIIIQNDTSTPAPQSTPRQSGNAASNGNRQNPTPTPPEEPGLLESLTQPVKDLFDNVWGLLGRVVSG